MPKSVTHALNPSVHAQTMCGLQVYEDRPPYIESDWHANAIPNSRNDREWEVEYTVTCKKCNAKTVRKTVRP